MKTPPSPAGSACSAKEPEPEKVIDLSAERAKLVAAETHAADAARTTARTA